jgi:tetratricopeptide (TPR) repeat protein
MEKSRYEVEMNRVKGWEIQASAWCGKGIALNALGRYEEAISSFDRAIEIEPYFPEAWHHRGDALVLLLEWHKQGNTPLLLEHLELSKEASASYEWRSKLKPDSYQCWYRDEDVLSGFREYEEAIASFDRAIESKAERSQAWYGRGVALSALGRYEEAVASFDRAIEIEKLPNSPNQ